MYTNFLSKTIVALSFINGGAKKPKNKDKKKTKKHKPAASHG
jgi:hypothetical protein